MTSPRRQNRNRFGWVGPKDIKYTLILNEIYNSIDFKYKILYLKSMIISNQYNGFN